MSDTQEHAGGQPAAEEYVPTHVLSSEDEPAPQDDPKPGEQPKPGEEDPPKPEEEEAKPPDPTEELKKLATATKARIDSLTRQRREAAERAEQAERRLAVLEERARAAGGNNQDAAEEAVQARIQQGIEQGIAERDERARVSSFHGAGSAAFPDWQTRCTDLMEMGADPGFARILVDMGADGAKVAGDLVDNPAEVARIANLPTERARAVALGQYAATLTAKRAAPPAPAPRSAMPPPIRPPSNARARPEPNPEGDMNDYLRWSEKQKWGR